MTINTGTSLSFGKSSPFYWWWWQEFSFIGGASDADVKEYQSGHKSFFLLVVEPTWMAMAVNTGASLSLASSSLLLTGGGVDADHKDYHYWKFSLLELFMIQSILGSNRHDHAVWWQFVLSQNLYTKNHMSWRFICMYGEAQS